MSQTSADLVIDTQLIATRLTGPLRHWRLRDGVLFREYRTSGWKASLMLTNAIGHLAELAWHHPDLEVSWGRVGVRLSTHSAGGVTEKDLALAGRIEGLAQWRPNGETGPLEGTPDDPRHAYIHYD